MKHLILLICLFSSPAYATDFPDWFMEALKSKNPNELAYFAGAGAGCPLTLEEVKNIVEGVFIRSRVKPTIYWVNAPLYLNVSLSCAPIKGNNPAYNVIIGFSRFSPKPAIIYDRTFGAFGVGSKEFITQSLKESVEDAMTAYIKANFDL